MRIVIIGQKWLGAETFKLCRRLGHEVVHVITPKIDRLHTTTQQHGVSVAVVAGTVTAQHIPDRTDLILAAHTHAFISKEARASTRLGAIGYHPSLLPRHRGRDAIRWAIHMKESITGGSVYWMDDGADTGEIAAQNWCHIHPDDTPETLWRRELGPIGLRLFEQVLTDIENGRIVKKPQLEKLATFEPSFAGGRLEATHKI